MNINEINISMNKMFFFFCLKIWKGLEKIGMEKEKN